MTDSYTEEVLDLHRFLDSWLKGRIERGAGEPTRLAAALADDFRVIHPDGGIGDKAATVNAFAGAYGDKPPDYALQIEVIDTRLLASDLCLVVYLERHRGEHGRARIASAILRRNRGGGIEWLHLQETPAPQLEAEESFAT